MDFELKPEVPLPITKSAKKSLRVSLRQRAQNLKVEKKLKQALKKADAKNVNEVISLIDKAAKTNLIHKNKAARLKSRLNKKFGTVKKVSAQGRPTSGGKTQKEKVKTSAKKEKVATDTKTVKKTSGKPETSPKK